MGLRRLGKVILWGAVAVFAWGGGAQQKTVVEPVDGRSSVAASPLLLWYQGPAREWTEALPIGNGRLGAMVFGTPRHERLQLNDVTVWSGGPQKNADRVDAYKSLPAIREALAKGDYALGTKLVSEHMTTTGTGKSEYWASYQTLGDLTLDSAIGEGPVTNYWRWLDLGEATSGVEFTAGGAMYRRESFANAPDGVIVTHLGCDQPGKIGFTLRLSRVASAATTAVGMDTLRMRGNTDLPAEGGHAARPGNVDYETQVKVTSVGGSVKTVGDTIVVSGANEATVVLAAGTSYVLDYAKNYRGVDPHEAVTKTLARASRQSYAELKRTHEVDYHRLFDRVRYELPAGAGAALPTDERLRRYKDGKNDPSLAALYYQMGRYLLIASSRAENPLPSNAQGIWGDGLDLPWKCDYKSNINYQMNYWPSETANLSELHLPAIRFDASLVEPGTKTAKAYYNAPGWTEAYTANAWGWTSPGAGMPWGPFFGGGDWIAQDIWEHYAFSRDRVYLKTYYPVLRGSAEFYLSILVKGADGKLVVSPSMSPENRYMTDQGVDGMVVDGSAIEQELVWDLFTNTIAAGRALGLDAEFRRRLEAAKTGLEPLKIGKGGQLEEWGHDWDLNSKEMNHRHVSHLLGAYPGWEISPRTTPELAAAVKRSLELRGDAATGWSNAWKINLWARLGDGDHAFKILNEQLRLAESNGFDYHGEGGGTYADLFDAHPPFQIDGNFGSTSGIDEMLLQSSQRYVDPAAPAEDRYEIELFPAVPSAWPVGSLHGLRARGGFEVNLDWKEGSKTAVIRSVGGTEARLRFGSQVMPLRLAAGGEQRVVIRDGKMVIQAQTSVGLTGEMRGSLRFGRDDESLRRGRN